MNRFVTIGMLAALSQLAYAHTELSSSVPADRTALEAAPEHLTLHFSAPVRLTALGVQQAGGAKQGLGPLPTLASKDFEIPVSPSMADGAYTVSWRAMSEDTHVMTGEFAFTVGASASAGHAHAEPATGTQHENHSAH